MRLILLAFLFYMSLPNIWAQSYDFQEFTVENGLSQSQVLSLHQINTGELWIGTNQGGVNKFNGSDFSYLTKSEGLSDNVVYAIAQDKAGRIYVCTNNGLNVIAGLQIDTMNTDRGLPHKGVVSILISHSNEVWLGTGKGVAKLVGDTIVPFTIDPLLSNSTVLNIREGVDGSLWFCTVQNGLFRWNGTSMLNISQNEGLGHTYVHDVMPLGKYDAWVFGYNGLYHLKNTKAERIPVPVGIADNAIFYTYQRDKAKNIWIGTSAGVLKYTEGKFKLLTKENGLVNNNIWKIFQDREGNIWFGSKSGGLSKLNSERFKLYSSTDIIRDPRVVSVLRTKDAKMWLGTYQGLSVWDGTTSKTYQIMDGLSSEIIHDMDQSADGRVFLATNYGLTIYDNGKFSGYFAEEGGLNHCQDVFVDGDDIWLGTQTGPALFSNEQISRPYNAIAFQDWVFDAVRKDDDIWFGYEDGVLKFDGKRFVQLKAKDGFFDGRTRSVQVGPDGNLWFGTNNGVYRYDGKECVNFGMKDGLISDAVYSLGFHKDGSLWVGQSKGLSRLLFDGNELEDVIRYGKEQGFMGLECQMNSLWFDDDSKIWVGATNGLVEYDPTLDKGAHFKPLTRITAVKLFSQDADWSQYADSVSSAGIPFNLELPYDKNHLTFEFTGVSLTSPGSINYTYILEGLDSDWQPITNNNSAKYSNIPPGTYTFKVRAGFGDELWKNRPVSFKFTVGAPFYRTKGFYALCLVVALAIAYSYNKIRQANIQITEQKIEIESQKDVIEKKNRALVDSINYASTIQSATLPTDEEWHGTLPDSFVLYKPKDIVSGDFYWLAKWGDDIFFSARIPIMDGKIVETPINKGL